VESPSRAAADPDQRKLADLGTLTLRYAFPAAVAVVAIGVGLRFFTTSAAWLDEAISINISKLPISKIPGALRHDGAPPLYYVVLHFWMRLFGTGDVAVRALSGVASVITLPFAFVAGKRLAGRAGGWSALVLLASSPFALSYATSARMYSLMILWSLLLFLALARALEESSRGRLIAVGVLTALILYTHYWGLYFVIVAGLWLLYQGLGLPKSGINGLRPRALKSLRNGGLDRAQIGHLRALAAMFTGSLAFLPWVPSFVFQTLHTGTPWSNPAGPADILGVLGEYSGGGAWGTALGLTLFTLLLLGLFGRSIDGRQVLVQLHMRRRSKPLAFAFFGTLVFAVLCGVIAQAAFVGRYTAVVFPFFILMIGVGATVFADRRVLAVVLAWACLCGMVVGIDSNTSPRTEAVRVAAVINQVASPGDLVVYCPDQLGPDASRLIHVPVQQATFPRETLPDRVNWVDYRKVIEQTNAQQFASDMIARAAGHDLWFVWRDGYPGLDGKCGRVFTWLQDLRSNGQELVQNQPGTYYEHEALTRFPV
jgi:mannosyltransferase